MISVGNLIRMGGCTMLALAVTACGGGGGGSAAPGLPSAPGSNSGHSAVAPSSSGIPVQISISRGSAGSSKFRRPMYISSATQSATVTVTSPNAPSATTTANCTTSCVATVLAPLGNDTFTIALFDGANGTGNKLSSGTVTQNVTNGTSNAISLVMQGVIASVAVSGSTSVVVGKSSTISLSVVAKDAANNVILGPFSSPVALSVSDSTNSMTLGAPSIGDSSTTVSLAYSGNSAFSQATVSPSAQGLAAGSLTPLVISGTTMPPQGLSVGGTTFVQKITGTLGANFVSPTVPQNCGDSLEYSESVVLNTDRPIDINSFNAHYTLTPSAPNSTFAFGNTVVLAVRKVPGVVYTISLSPGVKGTDGSTSTGTYTCTFTTPATPAIPQPIRSTKGDPYRYGILEHPWSGFLDGNAADDAQILNLLATAGTRFVRIDYVGSGIEYNQGSYDFSIMDSIATELAQRGITELPVIEQYSSPAWANGGHGYPFIWNTPDTFATFSGAVAAHLAQKFPNITRIELFNEPNGTSWWTNSNSQYGSNDGSATAAYMQAAYGAIKAAAPSMKVVGPALAAGSGVDPRTFFQQMYTSGCRVGKCWDIVSVHNYNWYNPTIAFATSDQTRYYNYQDIQQIAVQNGDPKPQVMLTEWGFSTAMQIEGFDPAVQAQYVGLGFNQMLADPTVDGIVYVNMRNGDTDFWGNTGLTNQDFSLRPGYNVFKSFATY